MTAYKLRAEFEGDINQLKETMPANDFQVVTLEVDPDFGEAEVEFTTSLTPQALEDLLNTIPDSHVMVETLNLTADYTGERTYTGYSWLTQPPEEEDVIA